MARQSPSRTPLLAALQMRSGPDVAANLDAAEALIREAAALGATMVGLPENFSYMGREADKPSLAEPLDGPTIGRLRDLARTLSLTLLAGGFPERSPDPARVFNTAVLIDPEGEIRGVYRKIHLFDVDLDEAQSFRESGHILPGDAVVAAEAGGVVHGLSICYDLRFPELYRRLDQAGAEILWVPSAFTLHTGKDHWEVLLRARAIENGAYVAAPAQFGVHSPRRVTYGNALVVDPWGKVVARASDRSATMALAPLDLSYREEVRAKLPTHRHHRLEHSRS
ncbi:MAG: carbon-nitrogen hydrolase family protein [Deltaproteobacteria bacterium]|nr:MAG: carbon-nitrogen hydrolase family protein [Deltaproteobacteria bacterium]